MAVKEVTSDLRSRDRARKNAERAEKTVVVIPKCEDPKRRKRLEADDAAWLLYYFGEGCDLDDPFWYEFTAQQKQMIACIRHAMQYGGDQALAASRGEGKTTLAERLLLKATLTGEVNYSVLFAATGTMADNSLDSIKTAITDNPLLAADYPEVCVPVIALEGAPQRANTQRVNGFRHDNGKPYEMAETRFSWCGQEVIFPNVPGSPSARAIVATRGLDAAVRGLKKRGKRPKLAIIDDPDTEDTARSEEQAKKLEDRIDKAIGGLGGQQRGIGRVMLTTLQSRIAVSYRYTDPTAKQSFRGLRFRFLITRPERNDLWDEYVQLRQRDLHERDDVGRLVDPHCRRSHAYYLESRAAMDAGAVVSNPNRFDPTVLPDGSQAEVSALQHYFNVVAKIGPEAVATEYDNDPPEETGPVESGITSYRVQTQVSGYPRGIVPPGCTKLTRGVDCKKGGLHWVVRAWRPDGTGYVIDYGFKDTHGTVKGRTEDEDAQAKKANDVAVRRAILELIEEGKAKEYKNADGEEFQVGMTLIDARYRQDAVNAACLEAGLGVYPVLGFGKSAGCWRPSFTAYNRVTATEKPGDNWNMKKDGRVWVVHANADHWKAWEHDRWMTDPRDPGCLFLFGEATNEKLSFDQKGHHAYSRHITAEVEVEEMVKGVLKRGWKPKPGHGQNHYLDASYYSDVGASILGIRLQMAQGAKPTTRLPSMAPRPEPHARPSIKDMLARK